MASLSSSTELSFRSFDYIKGNERKDFTSDDNKECPICLEELTPIGPIEVRVNCCSKIFHAHCLAKNILHGRNNKQKCPLCRQIVIKPEELERKLHEEKKHPQGLVALSFPQQVVSVRGQMAHDFEELIARRMSALQLSNRFLAVTDGLQSDVRQQILSEVLSSYRDRIGDAVLQEIVNIALDEYDMTIPPVGDNHPYNEGVPGNLFGTTEPNSHEVIEILDYRYQYVDRNNQQHVRANRCSCPNECKIAAVCLFILGVIAWGGYCVFANRRS